MREKYNRFCDFVTDSFSKLLIQNDVSLEHQYVNREYDASFNRQTRKNKGKASNASQSVFYDLHIDGSLRMSSWQRHQLLKNASNFAIIGQFGPPFEKTVKLEDSKNGIPRGIEHETPKINVKVNFSINPDTKKRRTILDPDGLVRNIEKIEAGDLLEYFTTFKVMPSETHELRPSPGGSVTWVFFDVIASVTLQEAYCFLKATCNLFQSVPLDYRHDLYTSVKGQLFYVDDNSSLYDEEAMSAIKNNKPHGRKTHEIPTSNTQSNQTQLYRRVICVALLSEKDPFKSMENQIRDPKMLITRAIRNITFDLSIRQSIDEIYRYCLEFDNFHERLFGPQEDEIGEEGMNPIRFAKMCRSRKKAADDAISAAPQWSNDDLKYHLAVRGLSDQGTRDELIIRVIKAFKRQSELVGFGELSSFGAEMVTEIFNYFDEDKDGALSLVELNKLLFITGSETIYSVKEYLDFMKEEELLGNSQGFLTKEGLMAYYERYGGLSNAIRQIGIGSINNIMQGEYEVRCEFEKESMTSLLNILEEHTLSQSSFKYLLKWFSSLISNNIVLSSPNIGSVLKCIITVFIPQLHVDGSFCNIPGLPAQFLHECMKFLADGEEGLIKSIRTNTKAKFSKCFTFTDMLKSIFEPVSNGHFPGKQDDAESLHSSTSTNEAKDSIKPEFPFNRTRKEFVDLMRVSYNSSENKIIEKKGHNQIGSDSDNSDIDDDSIENDGDIYDWAKKIDALLPPVSPIDQNLIPTFCEISDLLARASAANSRLTSGSERLTRAQRDDIQNSKEYCEKKALQLTDELENNIHICGAHIIAFYDSVRLFGSGISNIGFGTSELSFNMNLKGISLNEYLPPGEGEPSLIFEKKTEKINRAMLRKQAALDAIERERLRRDLTEEEKEKRRLWEAANVQQARDEEEKSLFSHAYSSLLTWREEQSSTSERDKMIDQWRHLLGLREVRYPNTIKLSVCQNNLACILLESLKQDARQASMATQLFRSSSLCTFNFLRSLLHIEDDRPSGEKNNSITETQEEVIDVRLVLTPVSPAAYILLLLNLLTNLKETKNDVELSDDSCRLMREMIALLLDNLTDKERNTVHLERLIDVVTVLPYGNIRQSLDQQLEILSKERYDRKKKREKEELARRLLSFRTQGSTKIRKEGINMTEEESDVGMNLLEAIDPRKVRKIKFEKTMKVVKKQRKIAVKQRIKMYNMIQSDAISSHFNAVSKKVTEDEMHGWGDENAITDHPFDVSSESESSNVDDGHSNEAKDFELERKIKKQQKSETGSEGGIGNSLPIPNLSPNTHASTRSTKTKKIFDWLFRGRS
jgi:hypothetical protein